MKTLRKTPLSLAVTASLGMAVTAFDAGAVNLATDGIGEVAIAPYYTTRNGWMTLINLTNTESKPIVVKVRIHEGRNTRDVLDFNVALSANDMWAAVLQEKDGGPTLTVADEKSCVIGSADAREEKPLNPIPFMGANTDGGKGASGGDDATDRLSEGYISFVVMGYAEPTTGIGKTIEDVKHTRDCSAVRDAFSEAKIKDTAKQFGEPINALKFNFRFLNAGRGIEAGGQAVTWANFFNHLSDPAPVGDPDGAYADWGATPTTNANCTVDRGAERRPEQDWDPDTAATTACRNLITAQELEVFQEPSLNDAYPRVGIVYDDKTNQVWKTTDTFLKAQGLVVPGYNNTKADGQARGVDAFSATIQRASIINEWVAATEEGHTEAEWVVTFPTKAFYVDQFAQTYAAIADGNVPPNARWETRYFSGGAYNATYTAKGAPYPPFKEKFSGQSCSQVTFTLFDRDEVSPNVSTPDTILDSPASRTVAEVDSLCYETNVLKFSEDSGIFGSDLAKTVDVSGLTMKKGWMELDLTVDAEAKTGLPLTTDGTTATAFQGLPAIGFMIKNRDRGNPAVNYVSTIAHAYTRKTAEWARWNN